jgi:phosphoribosyl-AMP cyclohydrolase
MSTDPVSGATLDAKAVAAADRDAHAAANAAADANAAANADAAAGVYPDAVARSTAIDAAWLDVVRFDAAGLVPVIAQQLGDNRVLMLAWADRAALAETQSSGLATYYSRSRAGRWRKGEESGNFQQVREMRIDCDGDAVLYLIDPMPGPACHTGRASCFFRKLDGGAWDTVDPVLVDPALLYRR